MNFHKPFLAYPLFFLFFCITLSSPVFANVAQDVTELPLNSPKIVGGHEAQPGAWPSMVGLVYYGDTLFYGQFCGGTLISPNWVLTAAHCVEGETTSDFYIIAGVHNLNTDTGTQLAVKRIIQHPNYNDYTTDNDFALIELTRKAPQTPMAVYSGSPFAGINSQLSGETATIIGWGITNPDTYIYSEALQQAELPVISNTTCNSTYPGEVTDNMLCAGYSYGGKDSCQADSGGPLLVSVNNQWVHAGVISWGIGCADPGYYGVYARTTEALGFIKQYVPDATYYPEAFDKSLPGVIILLLSDSH